MKNIFLLIVMGVLLIGIVSAAPPTQTNVNIEVGLDIEYPKFDALEVNKDFQFNFHVFNRSNGLRLDNTTTSCIFHLFNKTGEHIINEENMPFDEVGNDFQIDVLSGNFSSTGAYLVLVDCSTADFGGFVSFGFEVTPTGYDAPNEGEGLIFLGSLIAMLIVGGMFLYLSSSFKESPTMRLVFTSLTAIICIIIVLYSMVALMEVFWGFDRIISSYSIFLWVFLFIVFITFIAVLIAILLKAVDSMRIKRGLKEQ